MVYKIKMIVQVGTGVGLEPPEIDLLEIDVSLVERPGSQPVREMARHDFEVFQLLNTIPNQAPAWVDQPPLLFKRVLAIIQAYQPKIPPAALYRSDFGEHEYQRPLVTQIATPARVVLGDPDCLLPWINHHGSLTINDFVTKLNANKPQLQTRLARHFLTAWIDIGMYPDHLDRARAKPPGPNDPVETQDAPTPPSAADPASTSAAPTPQPVTGPSGTGAETRSPAQRTLGEPSSSASRPARRLLHSNRRRRSHWRQSRGSRCGRRRHVWELRFRPRCRCRSPLVHTPRRPKRRERRRMQTHLRYRHCQKKHSRSRRRAATKTTRFRSTR